MEGRKKGGREETVNHCFSQAGISANNLPPISLKKWGLEIIRQKASQLVAYHL